MKGLWSVIVLGVILTGIPAFAEGPAWDLRFYGLADLPGTVSTSYQSSDSTTASTAGPTGTTDLAAGLGAEFLTILNPWLRAGVGSGYHLGRPLTKPAGTLSLWELYGAAQVRGDWNDLGAYFVARAGWSTWALAGASASYSGGVCGSFSLGIDGPRLRLEPGDLRPFAEAGWAFDQGSAAVSLTSGTTTEKDLYQRFQLTLGLSFSPPDL